MNELQEVAPIIKNYSLEPKFVEGFGKVQKVYTDKGVFALKKISPYHGTDFIRHIQYLYQKGYNRIVPVYPTMDGRYAILHNQALYYLMPWLPNEERENRSERHQKLFRELARMHTISSREIPIDQEERTEHYEKTLEQWEKEEEFLEGFMEQCEEKIYPSPFEMAFILYFNDINQALRFSKNKLKEWYEKTKEEEKARTVVVHGKVSTEHFLYDDRGYGYLANFEKARESSPFHDLLPILSRSLKTYPKQCEECVDWLYTYLKYAPFKEAEMLLFTSYLAHPAPIIKAAEKYYHTEGNKSERKNLQHLQKQYWLLKNTEYVVMRIDEIEKQKQQAKEQAAQAEAQKGAQD
ncbi:spore coat protein YsxE [Cytobacillus spongiae]|uniref:spore coat protein YsxE n=1 Tax=Cytobacillus spongiae TaxID=2901381 RepID=UPI001F462CD2|nr:spore coat protein YsxE [Cytobacillus spongiae]UII55063.1 spore coat protein YsxE [Cytobacillus spongiae]